MPKKTIYVLGAVLLIIGLLALTVWLWPSQGEDSANSPWAFEETFEGLNPDSPSQELLPDTLGYVVTHRTHSTSVEGTGEFVADYGEDCQPDGHHLVKTKHGNQPDPAFFICKEKLMSSMGDVSGYSVAAFWPKQEFRFVSGGALEFETDALTGYKSHGREIVITPRGQENYFAAVDWAPISETYAPDSIVFGLGEGKRSLRVQSREGGVLYNEGDWESWARKYPEDPAVSDASVMRTMRITFHEQAIDWCIINPEGECDTYTFELDVPLPFEQGIVAFNTHSKESKKSGNTEQYTYQWDNIRFSGPSQPSIDIVNLPGVVYLESNGNRAIGDSQTQTVNLENVGENPALVGMVHNGQFGQVLVSLNGSEPVEITPHAPYPINDDCAFKGWRTFFVPIDRSLLRQGENSLQWVVGEPACQESSVWDGYSIKDWQIQFGQEPIQDNQRLTYEPLTSGDGLRAYYYNDINPEGNNYLSDVEEQIDFDWQFEAPRPGVEPDNFSARWEGFIIPEYSQEYTFSTETDDGVRLWINDEQLIDQWQELPVESQGTISLQAGEKYKIVMEYYDKEYNAWARLYWQSESQSKQIVPQKNLYTR
jgi:hypothetical protein